MGYNIPGDNTKFFRIDKFIEYATYAPTVCHPTIITYGNKSGWDQDEMITASFLHSLFYEELTAILLVDTFSTDLKSMLNFCSTHTPHTNPDKLRVVTMNKYPESIKSWSNITENQPFAWVSQFKTREELRKGILAVKNIGGFSADLFENCLYGYGLDFGKRYPEWQKTPQLSEGMLLLLHKDDEAISVHTTKSVSVETSNMLDVYFEKLCKRFEIKHPGSPPEVWYTKLCSFANLFHGKRYGGYHHDRQLANLHMYMKKEPSYMKIWNRIFWVRKKLWAHHMLGELNGWNGIRPERKKLWLEEGKTGVEVE